MRSPTPRFSILLPVFNGERYVRESIDSVLAQTHTDFELLIWDDGSTDTSRAILATYRDSRIRQFTNAHNIGLFRTLNAAIGKARGELVRLWAQDDRMKPDCLAVEHEFWEQHPQIDMSYCQRDIIDADSTLVRSAPYDGTPEILTPDLVAQISFYHGSMPSNISTVVLRRSVFLRIGLFREDLWVAADFEFWVRLSEQRLTGFIRRALLDLRAHQGQFSRQREVGVIFIRETRPIFTQLLARFPEELRPYARQYARWHQHVLHLHHGLRALFSGQLAIAYDTFRETRKDDNLAVLLCLWLLTGNGRWFKKPPRFHLPTPTCVQELSDAHDATR
ncbi:MAG: glycosyltransferase [Deltaproteobacteria bacterium]|nr:glycosyltransferase [Deltaproteobacteria bacterium]